MTETVILRDDVEQRMWDVVRYVNSQDWVRNRDVADEVGIPRNQISQYLQRAADMGAIRKLIRGVYGPGEST